MSAASSMSLMERVVRKQASSDEPDSNQPSMEKKPLRDLRNIDFALIYRGWWHINLFDAALKKRAKKPQSIPSYRKLLQWEIRDTLQRR